MCQDVLGAKDTNIANKLFCLQGVYSLVISYPFLECPPYLLSALF